jgi:hypothetical protein
LAEDEIDESKNIQLPALRENDIGKRLERQQSARKGQMYCLWQSKNLQSWDAAHDFWKYSTLSLQRLWFAFFKPVNSTFNSRFSFFFFFCSSQEVF